VAQPTGRGAVAVPMPIPDLPIAYMPPEPWIRR
jgi:hypothetical protein